MSERPFGKGGETLGLWSLSFLTSRSLRRAVVSAGFRPRPGLGAAIGVWGHGAPAYRGKLAARLTGRPLVTLEDGFLRSVLPGRGQPLVSLIVDDLGIYFDASRPSRLDHCILAADGEGAEAAMAALRRSRLSKYNHAPDMADPPKGHVLIVDQTRGDASIAGAGAGDSDFARMLAAARAEHPNRDIVIKTHPEVSSDRKAGYFGPGDADDRTRILSNPVNPWDLLNGAAAVYTVSSQMGMEAMIAGRDVRCFGMPFYAGWGCTTDEHPSPSHRATPSTAAAVFQGAYLDYPVYLDPWRAERSDFSGAIGALSTLRDAFRQTEPESVVTGARLWKRGYVRGFLGPRTRFASDAADAAGAAKRLAQRGLAQRGPVRGGEVREGGLRHVAWGSTSGQSDARLEDGFLRSPGLGASLTPPLSLALDDEGIYYDPRRPSRLERLIENAPTEPAALARADALRSRIVALGLSKYNLGGARRPIPRPAKGRVILVPGQVEDDASIIAGAGAVHTNAALLAAVRAAVPDGMLVYKPHPDVEAGLRPGAVENAAELADHVASGAGIADVLDQVDEVWTMTSTTGFEALLREMPVVCFGAPFYAGWGLTEDRGDTPDRRRARPNLAQLVHACLIDYPLYRDPVSGLPCPPEVIVERLSAGIGAGRGLTGGANRALSKVQGAFASYAGLWR